MTMPRTQDSFNDYVGHELREMDRRMDQLVEKVTAMEKDQAATKALLKENTEVAALRAPMEQTAQATAQQAEQFDNVTAGGNAMATEVMA